MSEFPKVIFQPILLSPTNSQIFFFFYKKQVANPPQKLKQGKCLAFLLEKWQTIHQMFKIAAQLSVNWLKVPEKKRMNET